MAKSTCNPDVEVPKGMMKFEVIRSTIRDSLGQYCAPGDFAVLTKKVAQGYLDKNFIKVVLPDFEDDDDDPVQSEPEPDAEEVSAGGDEPDTAERSKAAHTPSPRRSKVRSRASSNA